METVALSDLLPRFLHRTDDTHYHYVDTIDKADGVIFLCPVCFLNNHRSNVGVHSVICWNPSVPQSTSPTPGRWNLVGSGLRDLSLVAGSSSVLLTGPGCGAHFHVKDGMVTD